MRTIGDLLVEFTEKPQASAEAPVLTLTERNGFVRQSERFTKRVATNDVSNYKVVRRNDIAFNPYLLWAGAVAQNTIVDEGIVSPLYPTFRVRDGYDPGFVARLLLAPQLIDKYDGIAFGSVPRRRRSSVTDFMALKLDVVPPLAGQKRIAAILDRADMIRARRRQTLAYLESLPHAIYREMFDGQSYVRQPLGELVSSQQIGLVRSAADQGSEHPYEYVKMDAITRSGRLNLSSLARVQASQNELKKYSLADGDLVFNTRNTRELVGKSAVYRGAPRLYNNNLMRVRLHGFMSVEYLNGYLWSREGQQLLESRKSGTTSVFAIYARSLMTLEVPVPPLELQLQFKDRITAIDAHGATVRSALAADNELVSSLQSRAFRGEL